MTRAVCALALLAGAALGSDGLVIGDEKSPFQLRFVLTTEGKPAEAAWEAFLDKTFDYFDRDGDGVLSRAEAGRMFSLPLLGKRELMPAFDMATRAGWKAFCRRGGFMPVVLQVEPPTAEDQRLSSVLMRHLDDDKDGRISAAEWNRAPGLLTRFDANDDEALDRAELLALGEPPAGSAVGRWKAAATPTPDATLSVDFLARGIKLQLVDKMKRLRLTAADTPDRPYGVVGPGGDWSITFAPSRVGPNMREASEFLQAQFDAALDGRPALPKADVEADATLSSVRDLFPFADRDGDGRLTRKELNNYLDLIRQGTAAQTWITVRERGRSLFDLIDADGDGRLSYAELARAANLAPVAPWQARVSFGGPSVSSWGGVPLPAAKASRPKAAAAIDAPRWFRAMDRNGDGVLSPGEFVGTPERFRSLDTNGDGVLSVEEARKG